MSRQPFERTYEHPTSSYGPALTQESVIAFALDCQRAGRLGGDRSPGRRSAGSRLGAEGDMMRGRKPTAAMPKPLEPGYTCFVPPCKPIRITVRVRTANIARDSLDAFETHYCRMHLGRS